VAAQDMVLPVTAMPYQGVVEGAPVPEPGKRHHAVPPDIASRSFHIAFVIARTGTAITILKKVMGLKPAERTGPLPCAVRKDARHQAFIIVIQDRLRHAAEESEGSVVTIRPGFRRRHRIGRNKEGVAVGKLQDKVVGAQHHTGDDNIGLAEVRLSLTRWMGQRHKHLALTTTQCSRT